MKAKYSLMGLLCPNFIIYNGFVALLIMMSNSCFNRPALAQHKPAATGIMVIAQRQVWGGGTVKTLRKFNHYTHQRNPRL